MSTNFTNPGGATSSNLSQVMQATGQTIQSSWELCKMSWGLLWKQTLIPLVSLLVSLGGALSFSLFAYRLGVIQSIIAHSHRVGNTNSFTTDDLGPEQTRNIFVLIGVFLGYLFVMHLFNFFMKVALAASTNANLTSGKSGLVVGIGALFRHFFTILGWLVVSGVVGFFLGFRSSGNSANPIASIVSNMAQGFLDSAWKIITFLTIPVIVAEKVGPINAIKRSGQLVRDTWGRQLIGKFGIDAVVGSFTGGMFVLIVVIGGGLTYLTRSVTTGIISALVLISVLMFIGAVRSALVTIYQTVLYRYANKQPILGYSPTAFQNVFTSKQV